MTSSFMYTQTDARQDGSVEEDGVLHRYRRGNIVEWYACNKEGNEKKTTNVKQKYGEGNYDHRKI